MPDDHRKPPVKMESRDERVTVRFTPSQRDMLTYAARAVGDELSRYIRECALIGHTMRQSMPGVKPTVG